jgi:hypothetical protein
MCKGSLETHPQGKGSLVSVGFAQGSQGSPCFAPCFAPNVPHVSMWNHKIAPIGYANGGMVDESHVNIPDGVLPKDDPDKVFARLMPGELIIPVKHVPLVSKMLKKKGIKLPNM